jgi:hypothetical protein
MKFGAKKNPTVLAGGSRFAPNFIQNLYTVLKKRLWESRSTPTLATAQIFFRKGGNIQISILVPSSIAAAIDCAS